MATSLELRKKIVDIRCFKKDYVIPDRLEIGAVMHGFRNNSWHIDKIPSEVMRDLREAYPEHFP
ncbi:MAG: hypothetical protein EB829_02665 [Nitrosopumilus sp. H8]|nr:MAG: hypothetical protein EB829_02665 [Nitrosopumilus sp. H8]